MADYRRGFEDALELCLKVLSESKGLAEARRRIEHYLALVKEKKWNRIRFELGAIH